MACPLGKLNILANLITCYMASLNSTMCNSLPIYSLLYMSKISKSFSFKSFSFWIGKYYLLCGYSCGANKGSNYIKSTKFISSVSYRYF